MHASSATRKTKHHPLPHTRTRPTLGNGFALGVKPHRVWPIGVQVAEQAALAAAKGVVGHGHGSFLSIVIHDLQSLMPCIPVTIS